MTVTTFMLTVISATFLHLCSFWISVFYGLCAFMSDDISSSTLLRAL